MFAYRVLPIRSFLQKLLAMSLGVIIALFGSLYNFHERQTVPTPDGAVRVMTFNLRYGGVSEDSFMSRRDIVAQTVADYLPDSFGVQEAHLRWIFALRARLPEYDCMYVGRTNGFVGESSAVFFLKDRYELLDSDTFWLSETPGRPSRGWDASMNRVCTWVKLRDRETGLVYVHMNTHFDHIGQQARAESVAMILDKTREFTGEGLPVVCTGDFNFEEGSEPYAAITGDLLHDVKFLAADTMNGNTFHGFDQEGTKDNPPIDFIFCTEDIAPLTYKIITEGINGRAVSDHYPVIADLLIGE
ncbi:MAG: endonuclease/exonuclease/phosphatase family protein [Oscillospiraceae bacterium]|nr:endonuclease/exonuclease/phosphatase family protein [Oscillospiraceae bacterium]